MPDLLNPNQLTINMDTIKEKDFRDGWAKWMEKVRELQLKEFARSLKVCSCCNTLSKRNNECQFVLNKEQNVGLAALNESING